MLQLKKSARENIVRHPPTISDAAFPFPPSPPPLAAAEHMQEAARMISNLQTETVGVDLATLLRESPREAYAFQQIGVGRALCFLVFPERGSDVRRPPLTALVRTPSFFRLGVKPPRVVQCCVRPVPRPRDPAKPFRSTNPIPRLFFMHQKILHSIVTKNITVARGDRVHDHARAPGVGFGEVLPAPKRVFLRRASRNRPSLGHRG